MSFNLQGLPRQKSGNVSATDPPMPLHAAAIQFHERVRLRRFDPSDGRPKNPLPDLPNTTLLAFFSPLRLLPTLQWFRLPETSSYMLLPVFGPRPSHGDGILEYQQTGSAVVTIFAP
jgi:hypothetical protein